MTEKKIKLAKNKIQATHQIVEDYLNAIIPDQRRLDSILLYEMMRKAIKEDGVLWSNGFVGFGTKIHTSPKTGRQSAWMRIGFAPRKSNLTLYFGSDTSQHAALLANLGKHKSSMGCVYINKLADIDLHVLQMLITKALKRE